MRTFVRNKKVEPANGAEPAVAAGDSVSVLARSPVKVQKPAPKQRSQQAGEAARGDRTATGSAQLDPYAFDVDDHLAAPGEGSQHDPAFLGSLVARTSASQDGDYGCLHSASPPKREPRRGPVTFKGALARLTGGFPKLKRSASTPPIAILELRIDIDGSTADSNELLRATGFSVPCSSQAAAQPGSREPSGEPSEDLRLDDRPGSSEMPSPEARKPPQQRAPAGLGRRAGSAAAALFKRSKGGASLLDAKNSHSFPVEGGGGLQTAERPQSDPLAETAADVRKADSRSGSASGAQAGSNAEPAVKRRRIESAGGAAAISAGMNGHGARLKAISRNPSVDRIGGDASGLGSSQERDRDSRDAPRARNGSSLRRRRTAAAGEVVNGAASRRRRSGDGAAAPVTSLIEVTNFHVVLRAAN